MKRKRPVEDDTFNETPREKQIYNIEELIAHTTQLQLTYNCEFQQPRTDLSFYLYAKQTDSVETILRLNQNIQTCINESTYRSCQDIIHLTESTINTH